MSYLGYKINIHNDWYRDEVEAEIVGMDGERIAIRDECRFSVESSAREIVDYATRHPVGLSAASKYVLV